MMRKQEEKKVHELDKSQIPLFGGPVDNSVNQRTQEIELKTPVVTDKDKPVLKDTEIPLFSEEKNTPKEDKKEEERSYTFELFRKNDTAEEEGEDGLFTEDDEFMVGKEVSADQIINDEGMMEYRKTKARLEQQAKERRERLRTKSAKPEMTKDEFSEKWTLPAYLRRGVKMDNGVPHSSESFISRYNLNDDNSLLGNNKFLHDNVD